APPRVSTRRYVMFGELLSRGEPVAALSPRIEARIRFRLAAARGPVAHVQIERSPRPSPRRPSPDQRVLVEVVRAGGAAAPSICFAAHMHDALVVPVAFEHGG